MGRTLATKVLPDRNHSVMTREKSGFSFPDECSNSRRYSCRQMNKSGSKVDERRHNVGAERSIHKLVKRPPRRTTNFQRDLLFVDSILKRLRRSLEWRAVHLH